MSVVLVLKGGGGGVCDYPLEKYVLEGVDYDFGTKVGTLSGDPPADMTPSVKDFPAHVHTDTKDFPAPILGQEINKYYPADIEVSMPSYPPSLIGPTDA